MRIRSRLITDAPQGGAPAEPLTSALFRPVDAASLAVFRVAFGAIMIWEVWRFFHYGWIERYYIEPLFHFTYFGFEWVRPWPATGMYLHFVILGACAAGILLGLCYRLCAALFFIGFSYVFLLEQARYLNHFYLICLLGLILVFVPAHRFFSADAFLRPSIRSETIPAWSLWLLRAQIGVVYIFGGVAKMGGDWLAGEPMRMWLADRGDLPVAGPHLAHESAAWIFSYGGLFFDLLIVPLLLWRRTRPFAVALAVLFHATNAWLFQIGIFPWMMIAATLLFLPADWPRRFLGRCVRPASDGVGSLFPGVTPANSPSFAEKSSRPLFAAAAARRWKLTVALLGGFLAFQFLMPLRHLVYPGNVNWTEEGHRFAWHMKLRSKRAVARFFGRDPATGLVWEFDCREYLPYWQYRKMSARPDMILQFAHFLAEDFRQNHGVAIEVFAEVAASLNGRPPQLLVDPGINLVEQRRTLLPASWIVPLSPSPPGLRTDADPRSSGSDEL